MTTRINSLPLELEPVIDCQTIKGIPFPPEVKFGQLVITGPPGSGKTTLVQRIGGWSEEGYIDLSLDGWWRAQSMALRPREIHLGLPFLGREDAMALFEPEWLSGFDNWRLDFGRIRLPPAKRFFFSVDWHSRFVFEFLLPDPDRIFALRQERAKRGTHPVDEHLDRDQIRRQVLLFAQTAFHFQREGMLVYIREDLGGPPSRIVDEVTNS